MRHSLAEIEDDALKLSDEDRARLAVRLLLPSGSGRIDPLDAEAVVVRRKKLKSSTGNGRFELGLFFTRMDDVEREKLARYLAQA